MTKNLMGKTRKVENPYAIFTADGWEWRVLKSYQTDSRKPYARWFCAVKSPYTFGGWDMGDTYVGEVCRNGVLTFIDPDLLAAMGEQDYTGEFGNARLPGQKGVA
jgi:hypothetical protein